MRHRKIYPCRARRRGFTLIEATASTLIATVCIGVTASSLHIISYGGSNIAEKSYQQTAVSIGLNRMLSELSMAITVINISANSVTITHPDITGDDLDDQIAYSWDGTDGNPITRSLNGAAAVTVIENIAQFALTVDTRAAAEDEVADTTGEVVVAAHDMYPNGYFYGTTSIDVSDTDYIAEYFTPSYSDAVSCEITRVFISMKKDGNGKGTSTVSLEAPATSTYNPSGTPLATASIYGKDASDLYGWREFSFSGLRVPVDQGLLLVVRGDNQDSTTVEGHYLLVGLIDGMAMRYSTNGGATWEPSSSLSKMDMRCYVYGNYILSNNVGTGLYATGTLESIHINLATSGDAAFVVDTAVRCLNHPSISGMDMTSMPTR